jgi:hypothetical protein
VFEMTVIHFQASTVNYFSAVGVINDHLIDSSWYGDNTDQRGKII